MWYASITKDTRHRWRSGSFYRFIPDEEAEVEGLIRVIDESGEDYAYDTERFHPISVPAVVEKALLAASHS